MGTFAGKDIMGEVARMLEMKRNAARDRNGTR